MTDNPGLDLTPLKAHDPRQARRTDLECARDRATLANIKLRNPGATQAQLATMFFNETGKRLARRTIGDDLKHIEKMWLDKAVDDFGALRAEELARVNVVEQEAWDAWNQSKSDFVREVIERARKRGGSRPAANVAGDIVGSIVNALAENEMYLHEEVVEAIIHEAIQQAIDQSLDQGEDDETFVNKIIQTTESRVGDPRYLRMIHEFQRERRKILGVYAPELHQMDIRKLEVKSYIGWSPDDAWKKNGDREEEVEVIEGDVVDE